MLLLAAVRYCIVFPRQPVKGALPALTSEETLLTGQLMAHVSAIASRPHSVAHYEALEAAARYIEASLKTMGHRSVPQAFECDGREVRNIEVVIEPAAVVPSGTYVIGAHYDSIDESPGANDNGTGVAALIELAYLLRDFQPRSHRLRLVFYVNEEAPYGKTWDMGSWRHAGRLREAGERVLGMIALETIGYFSDRPGSQAFPPPFGLVYRDTGNFIAFVGLPGSRAFLRRALRSFRRHTVFPSIGGNAPGFIPGIDLSDHWAYHRCGFPAMMITDTAPFRNPYYHQPNDLPATVDYPSLARVTKGIERMVRDVVG
jgi:Iap family predicted aminopeptidase